MPLNSRKKNDVMPEEEKEEEHNSIGNQNQDVILFLSKHLS